MYCMYVCNHRFISDINRVAHVDDKTNHFKPHSNNDANELHAWGLGTTPINNFAQNKRTPPHATTIQKPPIAQQQLQLQQQQNPQNYQKPQATSHTFNPFLQSPQQLAGDKQRYIIPHTTALSFPNYIKWPDRFQKTKKKMFFN